MEKKSLEQHKEYLEECVKLSLWVIADWKNRHPNEDISKIINERTALLNHTDFNSHGLYDLPTLGDDKWLNKEIELKDIYEKYPNPKDFEDKGYEVLKDFIFGRAERDLKNINGGNSNSWLRYDINRKEDYLEIHMENSLYPNSFLADKGYFYEKLKIAVLDAEEFGYKGLWTCSWLNDYPAWQKLMPKEWNDSISNRMWDIEWHLGFWGQFLTANQCFNKKLGNRLRETGIIPYPMSRAQANIEVFKNFLNI